LLPGELGDG